MTSRGLDTTKTGASIITIYAKGGLLENNMQGVMRIMGLGPKGRVSSKEFEEKAQKAILLSNNLVLESYGQHNVGGRLSGDGAPVHVEVNGPVGQRLGCMGQPGTTIVCRGAASDDVGYLNVGADIILLGDATNGVANAMAQGRIMIRGSIGARALTMTKWNPSHERPELWVLGSVGDYFAEFNCGGIGVVCGIDPKSPSNILGYRPCVGMVGGWIFYRGQTDGSLSEKDVRLADPDDEKWNWLMERMPEFLEKIDRSELLKELSKREEWKIMTAFSPSESALKDSRLMSMAEFRDKVWNPAFAGPDAPLGGDPLRDLSPGLNREPIGFLETGELRRRKPVWANRHSSAPCVYNCPISIPTIDRLRLRRKGKTEEAVRSVMERSPLPASVCGNICPKLCMRDCSRQSVDQSLDMSVLGKALLKASPPDPEKSIGKKTAVIGGGPAGMGAAWNLAMAGIETHIFEKDDQLGGKIARTLPWERLPKETWEAEVARFSEYPNIHIHLKANITRRKFQEIRERYDYVIIAAGACRPRHLRFRGSERVMLGLDFLKKAKRGDDLKIGERAVIIGAGNAGCDIACEARRLGAKQATLIDIQKPLAFGKEKKAAENLGAVFKWPVMVQEVNERGILDNAGNLIPAETVIISIGDIPALDFLPDSIDKVEAGGAWWIKTDEFGRSSDHKILAVGDVEKPGLAADALAGGKKAADCIIADIKGEKPPVFDTPKIDVDSLTPEHYHPQAVSESEEGEADRCLSCGTCRDCELCVFICPEKAVCRIQSSETEFEYKVDGSKCVACGFCADTCPCGVWVMRSN